MMAICAPALRSSHSEPSSEMKLENLKTWPAGNPPLSPPVPRFDRAAHFADRQLGVLDADARLELHRIQQHLGPEGERDRIEHLILPGGVNCGVIGGEK